MAPQEQIEELFKALILVKKGLMEESAQGRPVLNRARGILLTQSLDFIAGYLVILRSGESAPLSTKAVIARALIETSANLAHIGDSKKRASNFVDFAEKISDRISDYIAVTEDGAKKLEKPKKWTKCSPTDRVRKLDERTLAIYDYLSNFVHGNNITDHILDPEHFSSLHAAIDETAVSSFIMTICDAVPYANISDDDKDFMLRAIYKVQGREFRK